MSKKVSLIVVAWNNLAYTKLFLWSIRSWTRWPYQLIFVDNGSTDGTREYLSQQEDVKLIVNKTNRGYSAAVNQAIEQVKTDYFCLLNNDLVVSPSWLTDLMEFFLKHPKIGQLTCNSNGIIDAKTPLGHVSFASWMNFKKEHSRFSAKRLWQDYYGNWEEFIATNKKKNRRNVDFLKAPPQFLGGWCLLMRKSILEKIGPWLYDPRFKIAYWEDVDLSWRVGLAGYQLAVLRSVFIHHFVNTSAVNLSKRYRWIEWENRNRFFDKWNDYLTSYVKKKTGGDQKKIRNLIYAQYVIKRFRDYLGEKAMGNLVK